LLGELAEADTTMQVAVVQVAIEQLPIFLFPKLRTLLWLEVVVDMVELVHQEQTDRILHFLP
jgi:hypothetical protein